MLDTPISQKTTDVKTAMTRKRRGQSTVIRRNAIVLTDNTWHKCCASPDNQTQNVPEEVSKNDQLMKSEFTTVRKKNLTISGKVSRDE